MASAVLIAACGTPTEAPSQETASPPASTTAGDSGGQDSGGQDAGHDGGATSESTGAADDVATDDTGGSTGGPEVCPDPSPQLPRVTWNVLEGPTPDGTSVVLGDGSDERAALQAIFDGAADGDVVFMPNPPMFYGIGSTVSINKQIEVRGLGFGEGSVRHGTAEFLGPEVRALSVMPAMFSVEADNVTLRGLGFVGPGRPARPVTWRDEHGIVAYGSSDEDRVRGLTVEGNDMREFIGDGMELRWVEGYILRNNRATQIGYAGILVQYGNYGLLTGNRVVDVHGVWYPKEEVINAYGVVITASYPSPNPICDHNIMSNNYVEDIPGWAGVMDHGGQFTLMMDNESLDCYLGLSFTGPGNDCLAVNNRNENSPRNGFWNIGRPRTGLIGNTFIGAAALVLSGSDLVMTDNVSRDGLGELISTNGTYGQLSAYEVRNDWGNWTEWYDPQEPSIWLTGASEPAVPTAFEVSRCGDQLTFRWDYDSSVPHHAFAIESSMDGESWERFSYRPPHNGTWDFDTDAHPDWVPLDMLRYTTTSDGQFFRIRALHGDAVSGWSDAISR